MNGSVSLGENKLTKFTHRHASIHCCWSNSDGIWSKVKSRENNRIDLIELIQSTGQFAIGPLGPALLFSISSLHILLHLHLLLGIAKTNAIYWMLRNNSRINEAHRLSPSRKDLFLLSTMTRNLLWFFLSLFIQKSRFCFGPLLRSRNGINQSESNDIFVGDEYNYVFQLTNLLISILFSCF